MINIKQLLLKEDRSSDSAPMGALMAVFPDEVSEKITVFGKRIIKDDILYKEGDEFGREKEGHVTIRYGFTKDLNELDIRQLLKGQKPFVVELYGLDKFEGQPQELKGNTKKPYDVVYLKARSPVLNKLNEATNKFPHEESEYGYNPHATIAYVKPGSFPHTKDGLKMKVLITTVCYSPISGGKSYFNLKNDKEPLKEIQTSLIIPSTMYHGSVEGLANRIWKYGLEPGGTCRKNFEWCQKGVYLTTDMETAKHFGGAASTATFVADKDVIILVVSTKGLDKKKFVVDPVAANSLIYLDRIPPKNIVDWKKLDE